MTTYMKKLKDPRWQKKRLEILERDKWTCRVCKSKEKTLHVHHTFYKNGLNPWEYPTETLVTLCEICHEIEEGRKITVEKLLIEFLRRGGFLSSDMGDIMWGLLQNNPDNICRVFKDRLESLYKNA